jgi:hypothetical protein
LVDVVLDVPEVVGAAAAWGAAATASVTPIPAEANPIARSGRTGTAIPFLTLSLNTSAAQSFSPIMPQRRFVSIYAPTVESVIPSELSGKAQPDKPI